ncbi:ABC transporter permease [Rhodococcus sp. NBC_00294]|uniref:ABC transporter permease n=1 Tax=Rhodococcus sp. NBC_00294 TaxID=2976004 RepID=UPI002E2A61BF|nr:ABC transporter permease [Rhodococcus sp. NBC_00294]
MTSKTSPRSPNGEPTDMTTSMRDAPSEQKPSGPARITGLLRLDSFSGLYLAAILVVFFSVLLPQTFATSSNIRVIAGSAAIGGILTLAVAVSMAAGTFDISLAANMTFSVCLLGKLLTSGALPWIPAVVLTIAVGAAIGAVNAVIITRLGVEPIIATLGMSSVLAALAFWVADGQTILLDGVGTSFTDAGQSMIGTVPITVVYLAIVSIGLWYMLEHTPFGRYIYAIGSNRQAAKLAGIRVDRVQATSLMITSALAALAGVVLTMQLGAASFGAGAPYLLPAFAATFLGSTQIRPGRFNVVGTIVALYLLAISVKGLQLQYPDLPWIKDLVEGSVLLVAVSITARAVRNRRSGR